MLIPMTTNTPHPLQSILRTTSLVLMILGGSSSLHAEVKPNPLFSDNAVLQRDGKVPVWGTADEGEKVTVQFAGQKVETVAKGGKWKVEIPPMPASSEPRTLTVSGASNTVTATNILVGEVWVASGQSNMEWALRKATNGLAAVASAVDPQLRLVHLPHRDLDEPKADAVIQWKQCDTNSAADFSAVAYYFGRDLRSRLGVPVGLIGSHYGGTPIEAWMDRGTLSSDPEFKALLDMQLKLEAEFDPAKLEAENKKIQSDYDAIAAKALAAGQPKPPGPSLKSPPKRDKHRPTCLYNGMIYPLQPFVIRGVIWNQGENNNGAPFLYRKLFPALITSWRQQWGEGDFPFLFVQIAPFKNMTPGIREAQFLTLGQTTNTAMTVTTDVGDAETIHPLKKEPVGQRLALAARALAYGEKIEYSGPLYQSIGIDGTNAIVSFTHAGSGLVAKDGELKGFTIAGADGKFVPGNAAINGTNVVVSSPSVSAPTAVRYGWENVPDVNLYNKEDLPASPFRTDVSKSFTFPKGSASNEVNLLSSQAMSKGGVTLTNGARLVNDGVEIDTTLPTNFRGGYYLTISTNAYPFKQGQQYTISYDYITKGTNGGWAFFHDVDGGCPLGKAERFHEVWTEEQDSSGHKEFTVMITNVPALLQLGIKQAAIRIENLVINPTLQTNK